MSALAAAPAPVSDVAELEKLLGDLDIPCEGPRHAEIGGGRVEHLARSFCHEACTTPLLSMCEGCLGAMKQSVDTLQQFHVPVRCQSDDLVWCSHRAALDVHPIRCAP